MFHRIRVFLHTLTCKKSDNAAEPQSIETAQLKPANDTVAIQSRRHDDLSAEAQLAYYMDKYLYTHFPNGNSFSSIRRIHDKEEQLSGVDVELIGTDGKVYCVDEKAQLYYLNKNLPTFAFELLFKRGNNDTTGWLCNPTLKTDFYMLIWPFATQSSCKGIRWHQFTKADCLLIPKKRLLKTLADKGLTVEKMQADAKAIRVSGQIGKIPIPGLRGIYYYASDPNSYREAPINIVISKSLLLDVAQRRYIVTPESVATE